MKQIKAVAGLIINQNGEVLCTQRSAGKQEYTSFKWEFPGGKVEEGETDHQALKRELQEELEIEVEILDKFFQVEHTYPDFHLSMPVYLCKLKSNDIKLMVHKSSMWLKPSEMMTLEWVEADIPVAQKAVNFNFLV